jgi:hypothetical protein
MDTICSENVVRVWKKTHRPEEYASDALSWLASESGLPRSLTLPFRPIATAMLSKWEPAADEISALLSSDNGRVFRTFFSITNYSNKAVYSLMEKMLRMLGIGTKKIESDQDIEFAWILLGGVLADYARRAGVSPETTDVLLDFRLSNSDYLTATTWFHDRVTITNLRTGRNDSLEIPAKDIDLIVDYSIMRHDCGPANAASGIPGSTAHSEYLEMSSLLSDALAKNMPSKS